MPVRRDGNVWRIDGYPPVGQDSACAIVNKYFELKNSWGADGAPQTRTTC